MHRRPVDDAAPGGLSPVECRVIERFCGTKPSDEIARILGRPVGMVRFHVGVIRRNQKERDTIEP
jgi:DNA-binding CsgD family transcriptional regulator